MMMIEIIHEGHSLGKAFNTEMGLPLTVRYCITCAGDFHGCYCQVDGCINCEVMEEVEV